MKSLNIFLVVIYCAVFINPSFLSAVAPPPKKNGVVQKRSTPLFPYKGEIDHIFFHPLIAHPTLNTTPSAYIDRWFITVEEFKTILESLYVKNYVLVSIYDTVQFIMVDEKKAIPKEPLVPAGKKPLIISVDDLNYYPAMKRGGTVHKLMIDANKNLASWSELPDGKAEISYDNEIMLILETFIQKHPDFSINGARGVIAVTGYKGVFGYNTHLTDEQDYEDLNMATQVATRLKSMGWIFASHSWAHKYPLGQSNRDYRKDEEKWQDIMSPILGNTDIFIFPAGVAVFKSPAKVQILKDLGYAICYGVETFCKATTRDGLYFGMRIPIDGRGIENLSHYLKPFFDAKPLQELREKK